LLVVKICSVLFWLCFHFIVISSNHCCLHVSVILSMSPSSLVLLALLILLINTHPIFGWVLSDFKMVQI
jgi:hypothetical protein